MSAPTSGGRVAGKDDEKIKELLAQLQQAKKRVPAGFWKETVIRKYVPEVLELLAARGRTQPTIRRIFYTVAQLHADFPKTKSGYHTLSKHLTDVRLRRKGKDADYRDWDGYDYKLDTFSDDSRSEADVPRFTRPKRFVQEHVFGLMYALDNYDANRWEGQNHRVEIMLEKRTMESTVKDLVKEKQVTVFPNSGNDGLSHQYEAYARWKGYQAQGLDVHVGYGGDLDEWGEYMDKRDYVKKILQMIRVDVANGDEPLNWNWRKEDWDNYDPANNEDEVFENYYDPDKPEFTFERIAITEEQVDEYNLMKIDVHHIDDIPEKQRTIQQKRFAERHGGFLFTVELDSIAIDHEDEFKQMILFKFIDKWYDWDIWNQVKPTLDEKAKDDEVDERITFTELAEEEYKKWKKYELDIDDEEDLNEILANSLGKDSVDELEAPEDLVSIEKKYFTDIDGERMISTRKRTDPKDKIRRRERDKKKKRSGTSTTTTTTSGGGKKKKRKGKGGGATTSSSSRGGGDGHDDAD
jgi:hypothetical protein